MITDSLYCAVDTLSKRNTEPFTNSIIIDSFSPQIIAAIIALLGVILGVLVNTIIKYYENKDKRRQLLIQSFETYYDPLATKLYFLLLHVEEYSKETKYEKLSYKVLTNNSSHSKANPVIEKIKNDIDDIYSFISGDTYRCSNDFKLRFYHIKLLAFIKKIKEAIDSNSNSEDAISFVIIIAMLSQIESMVNPQNWVYRKYVQIWKIVKNKKYNNY